jgi:hypothetical protein
MQYIDFAAGEYANIKRNGCYGCATDIMYKNNHMAILRQTHPHLWKVVMNYGMADELQKLAALGVNGADSDACYFDKNHIVEYRQCAFDDMGEIVDSDKLLFEYDGELRWR